jgi:hypothetical protein
MNADQSPHNDHQDTLHQHVHDAISQAQRESPAPSMDELIQRGSIDRGHALSILGGHLGWIFTSGVLLVVAWVLLNTRIGSDKIEHIEHEQSLMISLNDKGQMGQMGHIDRSDQEDQEDREDREDREDHESDDMLDLSGPLDFLLDEDFEPDAWAVNDSPQPL